MNAVLRRLSPIPMRLMLRRSVSTGSLFAAFFCMPAFADDIVDVDKLMRTGQYAEALARTDAVLAKRPHDAQMRFLKGVILVEQNKHAEAIAIFQKLTKDYPSLPEPHNNLAVLYAAAGQDDKARAALNAAIRTNPSYATAYDNLGDIHARLASQAYDKALQLESGKADTKSRLTLVRSLVAAVPDAVTPPATPAAAPKRAEQLAAAKLEAPASDSRPARPREQVAKPDGSTPSRVAEAPKAVPKPLPPIAEAPTAAPKLPPAAIGASRPAPKAPPPLAEAPKQEAKVPVPRSVAPVPAARAGNVARAEVAAVLDAWAQAWSSRDVRAYLAHYASDFRTPGGQPRKAWEDDRRSRIVGKGSIRVTIESPQITVEGNTATVRFRQIYMSDRLNAVTRKTLVLAKQGGHWKIKQETTGS